MKRPNNYSLILTILAAFLLIACNESKTNTPTVKVKEITFKEAPRDHLIASNFKDIHMVQLEINDDCIISEIREIIREDGKLFVLTESKEIFCFEEKTGKFIRVIGGIGEGPGEYITAADLFFNKIDNTLCVLDYYKNRIVVYSKDGDFIEYKDLGITLQLLDRAKMSKDGNIMFASNIYGGDDPNEYAYTIVRKDGSVAWCDAFAPIKIGNYGTSFAIRPMALCEDGIRFFKLLNDTIFTLRNGEVEPYCRLDFGREMPPKEVVAKTKGFDTIELFNLYKTSNYMTPLDEIYESKDFIAIVPSHYPVLGYYWIDKKTMEGVHLMSTYIFDDEMRWFLQGRLIIGLVGSDEKGFITSFQEIKVVAAKEQLEKNKDMKVFNDGLRAFFEKADPDGNPCLIFFDN